MTKFPDTKNGKIIILGATSAIAQSTAKRLAEAGASIALVARNRSHLDEIQADLKVRTAGDISVHEADLVSVEDKPAKFQEFQDQIGGCDAVLLFYGILGDQDKANSNPAVVKETIETNFTSAAEWLTVAAGALEHSSIEHPALIAVSSVAGDRGRRSNYAYGAAKGGLSIFVQGLAHRMAAGRKIRVVNMKLGFVRTPMTAHLDTEGPLWADSDQVAKSIIRAMHKGGPNVYAPSFWRWIMLAIRMTPAFVFNRINL